MEVYSFSVYDFSDCVFPVDVTGEDVSNVTMVFTNASLGSIHLSGQTIANVSLHVVGSDIDAAAIELSPHGTLSNVDLLFESCHYNSSSDVELLRISDADATRHVQLHFRNCSFHSAHAGALRVRNSVMMASLMADVVVRLDACTFVAKTLALVERDVTLVTRWRVVIGNSSLWLGRIFFLEMGREFNATEVMTVDGLLVELQGSNVTRQQFRKDNNSYAVAVSARASMEISNVHVLLWHASICDGLRGLLSVSGNDTRPGYTTDACYAARRS
jgi:hypothetical protein